MTYYFRELENQQEMLDFLRLRHARYIGTYGDTVCTANERGLDLDHYDLRARHYGLFIEEADQQRLIGGLRIIQDKPVLSTIGLLRSMDLIDEQTTAKSGKVLPILSYFSEEDGKAFNALLTETNFASEGSRLVLKEEYRSLRLAKFIISNAIILHLNRKDNWVAFVSCSPLHARLYQSYGFDQVCEATGDFKGVSFKALYLRKEKLTPQVREELETMAAEFRADGFTRYVHERKAAARRTA